MNGTRTTVAVFTLGLQISAASAQNPLRQVEIRFARSQPVIGYTLRVDTADLSVFDVEMRIRNVPDTFRVAMAAHPEYDDRYWRYVEAFRAGAQAGEGSVVREDSALWRVVAPGGGAVLRYRIRLPASAQPQRAAWRPFLSPTGGLVGGIQSFMYVIGATLAPSRVTFELPSGWNAVTGLEPTSDPATFFTPSADILLDSPALVGLLRTWRFLVDGVPHRVTYWPLPNATPFDTAGLVADIERLVRQTVTLFGRPPYREYSFLLRDGAYGALEHRNSVCMGAPSADLAKDTKDLLGGIAHEYFHTWNLMRIRPAEYGDIDYLPPPQTRGLWWSEGVTMFYADLLSRRAGLRVHEPTRTAHLEQLIGRYFGNPGNSRISPERVSLVSNGPPGMLGDYGASTHLQGELIGTMLDLVVRDATEGRHTMDDIMRAVFERFGGEQGFTGTDIERTVAEVCGCDVHSFFEEHVRGEKPMDFDPYLRLLGLRTRISLVQASGADSQAAPDLRVYAWQAASDTSPRLGITDPSSCWGKAGLHTGDPIIAVNGLPPKSALDFRTMVSRLRIGDTVSIAVRRPGGGWKASVVVRTYDRPQVRIEEIPEATERQRRLRSEWLAGNP